MKTRVILACILTLLVALTAEPTTRVALNMIAAGTTSTNGFIVGVVPSGAGLTVLSLPTGWTINSTTNPPSLVAPAVTQLTSSVSATTVATAGTTTFNTPASGASCKTVEVIWNGILLSPSSGSGDSNADFTVAANNVSITLVAGLPTTAVGDRVTIYCTP